METRINKDGAKVFRDKVYINGRAVNSPWFDRITDTRNWKASKLVEKKKYGFSKNPYKQDTILKDFCRQWIDNKVKTRNSSRTYEAYSADVKNHILPLFGELSLGELSPQHGDELMQAIKEKGVSIRTVNKVLTVFKTLLNDAVRWNYIPKNPLYAFPELKENPKADVYFTDTEIAQFLRANINDPYYPVYVTVLNTGLRLGEVLGLCWDRVNFAYNQLEITRIMTRKGIEDTTKTHNKRIVPMNHVIRGVLENLLRKQKSNIYVFTRPDGRPIRYQKFSENFFVKAQKRAGMRQIIKFHDLRHTYASQFMMHGGNIFDLQKILGHSSIDMTKKYAHLSMEHLHKASNIIQFSGEDSPKIAPNAIIQIDELRNTKASVA